jgi:hypothetical protein
MENVTARSTTKGYAEKPARGILTVCPHCWEVNRHAVRLCGRCGADMTLVLQESGGLRRTSPVQSPVPVSARSRLSLLQRVLLLGFVVLLAVAQLLSALHHVARRPGVPLPQPLGTGHTPTSLPASSR